jgi:hypothetical protein
LSAALPAQAQAGNPRVNQIGYLPHSIKIASYKTAQTAPQIWQLKQNGKVIARGKTTVAALDASSGDLLQQIDFSKVTAKGAGFTITVGTDTSYTFSISPTVFRAPLYDALKYFYHNRSGIAIETPFTGGGNTSFASDSQWARPAGHVNRAPNQGDFDVPCWEGTCQYRLDVPKGWYDAGDHGKYVVNGGISVWTLLNMFERGLYWGSTTRLSDGQLNIPARCLQAATSARVAALHNPNALYQGGYNTGGGAYDDDKVGDDFYWAAVELYLTTQDSQGLPTIDAYRIRNATFKWANTGLAGGCAAFAAAKASALG